MAKARSERRADVRARIWIKDSVAAAALACRVTCRVSFLWSECSNGRRSALLPRHYHTVAAGGNSRRAVLQSGRAVLHSGRAVLHSCRGAAVTRADFARFRYAVTTHRVCQCSLDLSLSCKTRA